jgi:uncharacterized protein
LHARPLDALLLTDSKPGHFHQAEGVLAAIARIRPVNLKRLEVRRRFIIPTRVLHEIVNAGASPTLVLRVGYGLVPGDVPQADIVVSAGGETLAANVAAARLLGVPNIFCGRVRRVAPEHTQVIVVSHERFRSLPNHLVTLPPSPFEIARPAGALPPLGPGNPPKLVGILIGGNTGTISYAARDWEKLLGFMSTAHQATGVRWLATTSRRSGRQIADGLTAAAADPTSGLDEFIDYRTSGSGTVAGILAKADAILVTGDSTTMISEAVAARLAVVGMVPDGAAQEAREIEYRDFLAGRGWYRSLAFSELTPTRFLTALSEIVPRQTSALEELAAALAERLPQLLGTSTSQQP